MSPASVLRVFFWILCATVGVAIVIGWVWGVVAHVAQTGFGS
jgi:hypothetical protein